MSILQSYRYKRDSVVREIEQIDSGKILNTDINELINFFYQKYSFPLLVKDPDRRIDPSRGKARANQIPVFITYPLKPDEGVETVGKLKPSRYEHGGGIQIIFNANSYSFRAELFLGTKNKEGNKRIEHAIQRITNRISQMNSDIEAENARLKKIIEMMVQTTRLKRQQEADMFKSWIDKLPVELNVKKDVSKVYDLKINKKIIPILREIKDPKEPALTARQVQLIIDYIKPLCYTFERASKNFSKFGEVELRDVILAFLNGIFEGDATGETFSRTGQTDIHLRVSQKDVLICECKIWRRQKEYNDAINQLFSYLTWRDVHSILFTFSKRKNFTRILSKAKSAAQSHSTYTENSLREIDDSYFITSHVSAQDDLRKIELHHLLYNLY
jgi:hypothetical protein